MRLLCKPPLILRGRLEAGGANACVTPKRFAGAAGEADEKAYRDL